MAFLGPIRDTRSLAGAVALIIVGAHLSVMMGVYFLAGDVFDLMQARWWWEISLNIQILVLVLMWICHSKRLGKATGWRLVRASMRFLVGVAGVLVPVVVLFLFASKGWRENPPDGMELAYYAGVVFVGWFTLAYILPVVVAALSRNRRVLQLTTGISRDDIWLRALPFGVLVLLAVIETLRGGSWHYIMWPFCTYLHGSMPYLLRAYDRTSPKPQDAAAPAGEPE